MKNILLLLALTLFASISSLASDNRDAKAGADIRKVMDEQTAAWNRGDIEGFMQGYWKSENLVFVSGDNVTKGWQPTFDRYQKNYDSREKMGTLTFSGLTINVLNKEWATVLGSWSLAREKDMPHGKFTLIFRKFKDGWRIVHDHTS
jgi:ketosteroid isomerase-like protein